MVCRNHEHDPLEEGDRIRLGKFVDIPENVNISEKYLCVGKVMCDKYVKMNIVHNVLQHAWEHTQESECNRLWGM